MKLTGIVNDEIVIAANNLATLFKKAGIAATKTKYRTMDTLLVEGLGEKLNCPILFTRSNKLNAKGKMENGLWGI